jgi:hypothetical protein
MRLGPLVMVARAELRCQLKCSAISSQPPLQSSTYWLPKSKSKSKLCYDRRSAGQSVLEQSTHLGLNDQIFIIVWQLRVCWFGAPSLTRRRVCRLQLQLVLASAVIFGSESRRTRGHILLSQIRDFHFRCLLRLTVEVFDPASTRVTGCPSSLLFYKSSGRTA